MKIGAITIGQAPRTDVTADILRIFDDSLELVQAGGLDGLTKEEIAEFAPGKEGMVHISKISKQRINRVEDVLTLGDKVKVICLGKDKMGRISFSMKDVPEEA